jgi:NADH:ubiquinone oxidoreductase subunit 5 (subunit L)/multisubunit Na+/H+ antiporter MnhA subunit
VERRTGETNLDKLGGLARFMPITFIGTLIAALAISGIPPFNGFASKWLIYQGVIELSSARIVPIFFLLIAMFGSVLTLASFLKVLHSTFLGERSKEISNVKEAGFGMIFPIAVLALLCIGFGVFATPVVRYFFSPILGITTLPVLGFWNPSLATILIIVSIALGLIIFLFRKQKKVRVSKVFIGGEIISPENQAIVTLPDGGQTMTNVIDINEAKIPGTAFYDSVKKIKLMDDTYKVADTKFFDIFEQAKKFIGMFVRAGKAIHNGLLHTYLGWLFLGFIAVVAMFFAMLIK